MKLYDGGRAPNPRRVRIFLAEKGMSIPIEKIDLANLEHKSAEFTALNPRVPSRAVVVVWTSTALGGGWPIRVPSAAKLMVRLAGSYHPLPRATAGTSRVSSWQTARACRRVLMAALR